MKDKGAWLPTGAGGIWGSAPPVGGFPVAWRGLLAYGAAGKA